MSKKKQQKNGFFCYMVDMQQDFKQQGRNVTMRDMPLFAGPSWSKLSDAQKHRYTARAKGGKSSGAAAGTSPPLEHVDPKNFGRRDCSGTLITVSPNNHHVRNVLSYTVIGAP